MANIRTSIPSNLVADVMFSSGRTCSVCRERGKAVFIHHIDENPTNNTFGNLSALCVDCHHDAQTKGANGAKLAATSVTKLRDEWLSKVELRRSICNQMAINRQVGSVSISQQIAAGQPGMITLAPVNETASEYIAGLPTFKKDLLGQTLKQTELQRNYDYIDALKGILVTLATYYSPKQFELQSAQEYFLEVISARFKWHYIIAEPQGKGTGGDDINTRCAQAVIADVDGLIAEMVTGLLADDTSFDKQAWLTQWHC